MSDEIKIINPFTDIIPPAIDYGGGNNNDFNQFSMGGGGENGLKADPQGLWFGSKKYADAPFKVDMSGNVTANSFVVTGGTIKYGKSSFSDSVHAGYYIGTEGVYMGSAGDTKKIKYDIAAGTFTLTGITLSWTDVSGAGKPADNATVGATWNSNISGQPSDSSITNPSYITSTKITATTIETPTITSGTVTGTLVQTDASSYTGVKMSSSLGGLVVYGQTFELRDTSNTLYGYIGGFNGYYNIATYGNRNMLMDAGGGTVHFNSNAAPLSDGGVNLGYYNYRWGNCYTLNLTFQNGIYMNYTGGYIQSNSQFRVVGSINLTGNMTFENYASLTIKDSGGTSRTLTCQYNSTLGKYILST